MKNKQKLWRKMANAVKKVMIANGKHELGGRWGRQVKQSNFLLSVKQTRIPLLDAMMRKAGLNAHPAIVATESRAA